MEVGCLYSNEAIYRALGVGNAGGVRVKMDSAAGVLRAALFTSIPTPRQAAENPYHDRLEGEVLVYTGAGLQGHQVLSGVNARLVQQSDQVFPIYGFAQVASRRSSTNGNKRWKFLGLLDYQRHYREQQLDSQGMSRDAWVFELAVHSNPTVIEIAADQPAALLARTLGGDLLTANDQELSASAPPHEAHSFQQENLML